ncbi:hypothetical protein [Micromonospora sp. CA-111912]
MPRSACANVISGAYRSTGSSLVGPTDHHGEGRTEALRGLGGALLLTT